MMHPLVQRFIEVLTDDVKKWEQAAATVDKLIRHVPQLDREKLAETATEYRERAEYFKSLIEQVKEDPGNRD